MKPLALRIFLAFLAIGALLLLAARELAPHLAWWQVGLWAGALALAVLAAVLAYVMVAGPLRQWLLRHGATDTQWLWFTEDPKGLERGKRHRE